MTQTACETHCGLCHLSPNLLKSGEFFANCAKVRPLSRGCRAVRQYREPVAVVRNLIALGISHNSAAVEVRERVAFAPEQVSEALLDACAMAAVEEVVILSTCNRTEIYAVVPEGVSLDSKAQELIDWVANYHHQPKWTSPWQNWTLWQYTGDGVCDLPRAMFPTGIANIRKAERNIFSGSVGGLKSFWSANAWVPGK